MAAHGHFHWNELMTRDIERAKKFYADTLGWTYEAIQSPDGSTYWVASAEGQPVAGIFDLNGPEYDGVPESWMAYIAVDDIDTRLRKAAQAGAKVMKEPLDVPGVGRIAILSEPGGAGIGWMTPA
jgi:predicted enzyme related to lactoylglutathione lyase